MPQPVIGAEAALERLEAWEPVPGRDAIRRQYRFKDFAQAFAFMTRAAAAAEAQNHHPEWTNVYNRVDVVLTTHDAGGVTEADVALGRAMDAAVTP